MINTFICHLIYEQCIEVLFSSILNNFSKPSSDTMSLDGKIITAVETMVQTHDATLKVVYSDVHVIKTNADGMEIFARYGTMQEYPISEDTQIYLNSNFNDFIHYEDIVEIFE